MIGFLSGQLHRKSQTSLVLNVNGVGYEVFVTQHTLQDARLQNGVIELEVYTHVTENHLQLFGFLSLDEKNVFKKLISISGVGPKMALAILSGLTVSDLVAAIIQENIVSLTQISGVGKKTAERIVIELKDKFQAEKINLHHLSQTKILSKEHVLQKDTIDALISLGYAEKEVKKVLQTLTVVEHDTVQTLIKKSLGVLAQ